MKMEIPLVHNIQERTFENIKSYFQPDVFIEFCKACKYYNKIWTCPPYNFDITKMLEDYNYAYIIGSKLYINELGGSFKELLNEKDLEYVINEIYKQARAVIDEKLATLGNKENNLSILLAGRCLLCDICTREKLLPCSYPEKTHYSLESLGFNVSAICDDVLGYKILWAKESLPEYLIFASAVFSQEKMEIEDFYNIIGSK